MGKKVYRLELSNFLPGKISNFSSFWYDSWSPHGRLHDLLGNRGFIDLGIVENSTVEEALLTHRRRRHRVESLNQIEETIAEYKQKRTEGTYDVALWRKTAGNYKKKFSSHDTWNQIRDIHVSQAWTVSIWYSYATPKYSFLMWLAIKNRLSTGDRMQSWNYTQGTSCIFCDYPIETRDHIFFECNFSASVWKALASGVMLDEFSTNWSAILDFTLNTALDFITTFVIRYVFHIVTYEIWRERNLRRHGEQASSPARLVKLIDKMVRNRLNTIREAGDQRFAESIQYWFSTRNN